LRDAEVIDMEFSRCKMAAIQIDDPRCVGIHTAVSSEVEDSRCRYLAEGKVLEVDEGCCRSVTIAVEDPRCRNLYSKW
jgi:hypothetical protein